MDEMDLLIDLHVSHERQGPGSEAATVRAIELAGLSRGEPLTVADLGCGTGASSLVLARRLDAHVTAVDLQPRFVERLRERAGESGVGDRIDGVVCDMATPPFAEGSLDVIWSEGAVYNVGFDAGVRAWRRFLKPGGVLAVTELSWRTAERPASVEAHWRAEYPGIATAGGNLLRLEEAGYEPLGMFWLPSSCWEEGYYGPIEADLEGFVARHGGDPRARAIADAERVEIELFRTSGAWFGYAFFVARWPSHGGGFGAG